MLNGDDLFYSYTVAKKELKEFTRDIAIKNEEKQIKLAMDKALSFFDARDLPSNWDKLELLGSDSEDEGESDVSRASDVVRYFFKSSLISCKHLALLIVKY